MKKIPQTKVFAHLLGYPKVSYLPTPLRESVEKKGVSGVPVRYLLIVVPDVPEAAAPGPHKEVEVGRNNGRAHQAHPT